MTDRCRFCRLFAISVCAFAALLGGLATVFGGDNAASLLVDSVVRSLSPAAVGSALLLALVMWAHPLPLAALAGELRRILRRALMLALPGYLVAALIAVVAGIVVVVALGRAPVSLQKSFATLRGRDFGLGFVNTACDAGLIVFLAQRYLVRMQAGRMSLPAKLVMVLTVSVPLRATVALLLSLLLPS
jgi:hypothetical protein